MELLQSLQSRWRSLAILGGLGVGLLFLVTNYTLVHVTVETSGDVAGDPRISYSTEAKTASALTLLGVSIMPLQANIITASVSSYSGSVYGSLSPFINIKKIHVTKDNDAVKYSSSQALATTCSSYDATKDTLMSYGCEDGQNLYTFKKTSATSFSQSLLATTPRSEQLAPFKAGVLGITSLDTANPIFYTSSDGTTTYYPLPAGVTDKRQQRLTAVTSGNAASSSFLLVSSTGDVHIGTVQGNSVRYGTYNHPDGFNPTTDTVFCGIGNSTASCYFGKNKTARNTEITPRFVTFTLANSATLQYKQFAIESLYPNQLLVTSSGDTFFRQDDNLYAITTSDEQASQQLISQGAANASVGDALYYSKEGKLYKVSPADRSIHLVFQSPLVSVIGVTALGPDVFFNARLTGSGDEIHKYKLSSTERTAATRIIDSIPSYDKNLPVSRMELYKNQLIVRLKVVIDKDAKSAAAAVDQGELADAKEKVNAYLQQRGVPLDELIITYTY